MERYTDDKEGRIMKVNAYICYWRDISLLRLTLPMVLDANNIFVHDGRSAEFPDDGMYSEDGVKELCSQHMNVHYIRGDRIYRTQMDKRNVMFEFCPANEWILVVDTDELMLGMNYIYELMPPAYSATGTVMEYTEIAGMMFGLKHVRMVKNVPKMRYEKNHYGLTYNGEPIDKHWDSHLSFMHIRTARTKERMRKQNEYYRNREEVGVERIEMEKVGTDKREVEREFRRHGYNRIR